MVGEIAHLVERVPGRQLYDDFVLNLRDRHRYVKEMLLGPRHRDGVTNGGLRRCRGEESDEQQREAARSDHTAAKRHRLSSGDSARGRVWPACARSSRSFSHKPSKLPFDITTRTSPGSSSPARYTAISAAEAKACAGRPRARSPAATRSGESRSDSASKCGRLTGPITTASARASASGSADSNTLRRSVFERGSKAAHSRRPGHRARAASSVPRIAVGWWAKSSTTVTPPASPLISRRRRTLRKLARACSRASRP